MAPRLPKPVPWHSAEELTQVHSWFYPPPTEDGSPNIQAQECALRRVKAWEARGKLPHAIDSTASFVQAIVRDWTMSSTDQELRLLYSMIFIRFVNGYVDAFQQSKSAKSIAYLAVEKVGMPVWFVELRHTATHDYLPSLTILRSATNQALSWINENYWMPQLAAIKRDEEPSPEVKSAMKEDIRAIVENYRNTKESQIEANAMPNPKNDSALLDKLVRDLIRKCGGSGDNLVEVLVPILLESGMLIPKSKKMRASARDLSLDNMGRLVDYVWMPLMNRVHQDLGSISSVKDGATLAFWVPLIDGMLALLFEANGGNGTTAAADTASLSSSFQAPASPAAPKVGGYLITILAWIKYLIKHHYDNLNKGRYKMPSSSSPSTKIPSASTSATTASTTTSEPAPRLSIASLAAKLVAEQTSSVGIVLRPMFEYDDLLNIVQDCLENSLANVSPLVRSILNTFIECDAEIKEKIGPILKVIDQKLVAGTATTTSTLQSGRVLEGDESEGGSSRKKARLADQTQDQAEGGSFEDETVESPPEDGEGQGSNEKTNEVWTLYDVDQWRPCPIGCLPGGIIPDLSLPFDLDMPPLARIPL